MGQLKAEKLKLIGVVHLEALPGSVAHRLDLSEIVQRALGDARILADAGFDAAIIENYGDMPFSGSSLSPAAVAAMAIVADRVRCEARITVGVNALRNDARSAMGIAAAVGAAFIRVNVHTGVYATDQGLIEGRAHETLQYRKVLGAEVAVFADVAVKHAVPISDPDVVRAARDSAYRGLADGLIVTGAATGESVNMDELRRVRAAVPDRPVFVGSGATAESVAGLLQVASGVIVGTAIKVGGRTQNRIDKQRAEEFVKAARQIRR